MPLGGEYLAWNTAICERYYPEGAEARPAYLALDDDEICAIGGDLGLDPAHALEEFVAAIRVERPPLGALWSRFLRARRKWRDASAEGDPPYVAVLGLCVLAASRMARDEHAGVAANAYYPHLNKLLGNSVDAGMPPGFETLHVLWEDLDEWLESDCHGQRGRSTIRTHSHFRHIGWPLSQCLLRAADRHRLPDFFQSAGLEPHLEIEHAQLWALFRAWVHPGCGLTDQAIRTITGASDRLAETIVDIVAHELESWDGELRDAQGRRRGEIALLLEKSAGGRGITACLVARRPAEFPTGAFTDQHGQTIELAAAGEGWYRPLGTEPSDSIMREGLTLAKDEFSLAYEPSPVVPFRSELEPVSGWLSARRATAVEEHLVLSHRSVLDEVSAFLRRHAQPEWRVLPPPDGNLPVGWLVIDRVFLTSSASSSETVPPALKRLVPRLDTATHFEGGLQVAPGIYLTGGEPDLWVTVGEGQEAGSVEIDGRTQEMPPGAAEFKLSEFGLEEGGHAIVAAGITRRFESLNGYPLIATHGTAARGHVIQRHGTYAATSEAATHLENLQPPRGTVHLCGAAAIALSEDLPLPDASPVLLRSRYESYELLGPVPGQVVSVSCPERPEWLAGLGLADRWQFFDQPVPFPAQWVVLQAHGVTRVEALAEGLVPPQADNARLGAPERRWAEVILAADTEGAEVAPSREADWARYVSTARELIQGVRV